ncbi:hypothetical protein O6H91_01G110600 [Diphasiastrum complanatum]|uniref:Uncharacterized protein n=6 Tax=Diphasiastrum complanatum TaxID=34168 RepID=A0ACC2EUS2_DIPCM|nr:hypothetical protein O6H91_01G110600 [Diphasiastrum complanatum]KAJ7570227.1 hypothetical protein O6H91_01G110600 [Diphasiastrum complanatum]KAJ7570228.1 hypothetical protein O6H91_01G110600 [Diphasiastrum complanatum]
MDQDDVEFEQLLGEIPRATSAPPQVEEHHRGHSSGLFLSSSDVGKPFSATRRSDGPVEGSAHIFSREKKLIYSLPQQQQQLLKDDHALACSFGSLSLNSNHHHRPHNEGMMHAQGIDGQRSNGFANGNSFADETVMALPQEFSLETTGQPIQKLLKGGRVSRSSPVDAYAASVHNQHHLHNQSIHASSLFPNGSASSSNLSTNFSKQPDWNPFTVPHEHLRHSQLLQDQISLQRRVHEDQIQAQLYASLQSQASVPGFAMMPVSRMHSSMQTMQPALFQPCIHLGDYNQQLLYKQRQHLSPVQQVNWGGLHPQVGPTASAPEPFHLPQVGGLCCSSQGYCSQDESCSSALAHSEAAPRNSDSHLLPGSHLPTKLFPQFNTSNTFQAAIPGTRIKAGFSRSKAGSVSTGGELLYPTHELQASLHSATLLSEMYPKSQSVAQVEVEAEGTRHFNAGTSHLQQQPKYSSLEEVKGQIYAIAKDQHGCRFLQRKFDEGSVEDIKTIFSEIFDHIVELMTDPFGNYLIQKLLEVCTESQRMQFLLVATQKAELVSISLNMHGTRAVQKLIETLTSPEQVDIVIRSLQPGVVNLIKDLNGNHVVQRCLQHLSNKDSQFIFDAAASHCVEIATHRHGCCVLQRCVDFSSGPQRDRLFSEIAANALVLSQDPYGNYVVQYILDLNILWASNEVMVRLGGNYPQLAMQKFSSNVVEKCLKLADEENRTRIIHELITSSSLGQLLHHEYANYVIQCALSVSKGALHTNLVEALRPHLPALRSSPYGKRILSRTNLKKMQFVRA